MAFMDSEDVAYRDDGSEEYDDEFSQLASEVFPDVDPEQHSKLKRMIELCVEKDLEKKDDDKGGIALILGGGKPGKK